MARRRDRACRGIAAPRRDALLALLAGLAIGAAPGAPRAEEARRLGPEVEAALVQSLERSTSLKVRLQAAIVLGRAGTSAAVPSLVGALDDEHHGVRAAAALALGNLGRPEAIGPLVRHADDPEGFVRDHLKTALLSFRDPEAVPALAAALPDASLRGREWIAEALGRAPGDGAVAALLPLLADAEADVRAAAERAVERMGPDRRDPCVLAALRSERAEVRAGGARLAGRLGVFPAIDPLLALAATDVEVAQDAKHALFELRGLLDGGSLSATIRGDGAPERRARALSLVGIRGGPDARALVLTGLADPDPGVRAAAGHAMLDLGDAADAAEVRKAAAREADDVTRLQLEAVADALERGRKPAWRTLAGRD